MLLRGGNDFHVVIELGDQQGFDDFVEAIDHAQDSLVLGVAPVVTRFVLEDGNHPASLELGIHIHRIQFLVAGGSEPRGVQGENHFVELIIDIIKSR